MVTWLSMLGQSVANTFELPQASPLGQGFDLETFSTWPFVDSPSAPFLPTSVITLKPAYMIQGPRGQMNFAGFLATLLRALHGSHHFWFQETIFTPLTSPLTTLLRPDLVTFVRALGRLHANLTCIHTCVLVSRISLNHVLL